MEEKELLLLEQINTYPINLSNLTKEEIIISNNNLKKSIQNYFNYYKKNKITNQNYFFKISTTLFHRIINSHSEKKDDWPFIKEAYDNIDLIKNEDYINITLENIKKLSSSLTQENIKLITNELNYLLEEMEKYKQNIAYIYNIKKFASKIFKSLIMNQIYDQLEDNNIDFSITDICLDIIIKDITHNKTIKIDQEWEKLFIDLIHDNILNHIFRDDQKFVIACNSMLNLNGKKETIKLIEETKKLEDNLTKIFKNEKIEPIYDIYDIKNRHHL